MPPFAAMRITCKHMSLWRASRKRSERRSKIELSLMCAEALPWRCHRSLIADALLVRGIRTEDVMSATRRHIHTLTPFAQVRGTTIAYPAETSRPIPMLP
jgi:uncharacterized protein (DUF488 family)